MMETMTKDNMPAKVIQPWDLPPDAAKDVEELSFTGRDPDYGRMVWWRVTPPATDYWSAHTMVGRGCALELLDLIHNPKAEVGPSVLAFIVEHMIMSNTTQGLRFGFLEVLGEYLVTGTVDR